MKEKIYDMLLDVLLLSIGLAFLLVINKYYPSVGDGLSGVMLGWLITNRTWLKRSNKA